jgi:hypothetical protein
MAALPGARVPESPAARGPEPRRRDDLSRGARVKPPKLDPESWWFYTLVLLLFCAFAVFIAGALAGSPE